MPKWMYLLVNGNIITLFCIKYFVGANYGLLLARYSPLSVWPLQLLHHAHL